MYFSRMDITCLVAPLSVIQRLGLCPISSFAESAQFVFKSTAGFALLWLCLRALLHHIDIWLHALHVKHLVFLSLISAPSPSFVGVHFFTDYPDVFLERKFLVCNALSLEILTTTVFSFLAIRLSSANNFDFTIIVVKISSFSRLMINDLYRVVKIKRTALRGS